MSDTPTPVNLFFKEVPTGCYLQDIYDPDKDGELSTANGKYVLKAGSAPIIDKNDLGAVYYVESVNPTTYKHTFKPIRLIIPDQEDSVSIVSYGNDRYMLYYDDRTKPVKLVIDRKLFFVGYNLVEYRLYRTKSDGTIEYLSIYLDNDDKFKGERIPMATVTERGDLKYPTNCHTLLNIDDGETIVLEVYDTLGILSAKVSLTAMRADICNDLATDANPIVKFDMECLQTKGDNFYIYAKQDPNQLNILPYVIYQDGTRRDIPVDNKRCFIYGFDEYNPSFPGFLQPILAKVFLTPREVSTIDTNSGKYRYISAVRNLITIENTTAAYCKLSIIPYWDKTTQAYKLRWFCYLNSRDKMFDVTDSVVISEETPFDGTSYTGNTQKLTVTLDLAALLNIDTILIHSQNVWLTLKPQTSYDKYLFKDGVSDDYVYGVEASDGPRRPTIHYDFDISQYFIPTSIFRNTTAVLENFYYASRPMYDPLSETSPITPTHFNIRDMYGRMVIASPIELEQYTQSWSILPGGVASRFVNDTLIVEWLKSTGENQYEIIYGTPVEVVRTPTNYNTESAKESFES